MCIYIYIYIYVYVYICYSFTSQSSMYMCSFTAIDYAFDVSTTRMHARRLVPSIRTCGHTYSEYTTEIYTPPPMNVHSV